MIRSKEMRWLAIIVMMFLSVAAFCNPADSSRYSRRENAKIEREQKKIEREKIRISKKWDERSKLQKVKDRRILVFMGISAVIVLNSMVHKE